MTFYDAINTLLEKKSNIKLDYPINLVMGLENSEYIDIELYGTNKKIDEILNHEIIDDDLSIVYKNEKNVVYIESGDNPNIVYIEDSSCEQILNSFTHIGITQDNKFNIYLSLLPENTRLFIDGIIRIDDTIEYPEIEGFAYQNLYKYQDEKSFINAIYIEFIIRNARYNNLLSSHPIRENIIDGEIDSESDYRMMILKEEIELMDKRLLQYYGLDFEEISKLELRAFKSMTPEKSKNYSCMLNSIEPAHNIVLSINLPREELLNKVNELKDEYEKNKNSFFPLQEKLNNDFLKEANIIINKFPKSFKKKQNQLIKALFIFDYINSHNKNVDELNIPIKEKYEEDKKKISNEYLTKQKKIKKDIEENKGYQKIIEESEKEIRNLEREKRKKLLNAKKEKEENLSYYTKMNPLKYKNSVFNEIASLIKEKPKQCTKIHNFIHKFLQKQIIT